MPPGEGVDKYRSISLVTANTRCLIPAPSLPLRKRGQDVYHMFRYSVGSAVYSPRLPDLCENDSF
jgi:hypothetical protein